MKIAIAALALSAATISIASDELKQAQCADIFDQTLPKLHSSKDVNLCDITQGKTVLIVNTASKCGFTPQFKQLQSLYDQYGGDGFTIVGFPSNDFRQEERNEEKIAEVCYKNFGVTFTMVEPVSVKGATAIDIFEDLAEQAGEYPRWNFHKYLVDAQGNLIESYDTRVNPLDDSIVMEIEQRI